MTYEVESKTFTVNIKNIKQQIGIELTYALQFNIQKNITAISVSEKLIFKTCYDGKRHTYSAT